MRYLLVVILSKISPHCHITRRQLLNVCRAWRYLFFFFLFLLFGWDGVRIENQLDLILCASESCLDCSDGRTLWDSVILCCLYRDKIFINNSATFLEKARRE